MAAHADFVQGDVQRTQDVEAAFPQKAQVITFSLQDARFFFNISEVFSRSFVQKISERFSFSGFDRKVGKSWFHPSWTPA
jgi:hypothetical protein